MREMYILLDCCLMEQKATNDLATTNLDSTFPIASHIYIVLKSMVPVYSLWRSLRRFYVNLLLLERKKSGFKLTLLIDSSLFKELIFVQTVA